MEGKVELVFTDVVGEGVEDLSNIIPENAKTVVTKEPAQRPPR